MNDFVSILSSMYGKIILEFENCKILGLIDTVYETMCYDENEGDFIDGTDYIAIVIRILDLEEFDGLKTSYQVGQLFEISKYNVPVRIYDEQKNLIWKDDDF